MAHTNNTREMTANISADKTPKLPPAPAVSGLKKGQQSMIEEASEEQSRLEEEVKVPEVKKPAIAPPLEPEKPKVVFKAPVMSNFLAEFQQMNKQAQSSTASLQTPNMGSQPMSTTSSKVEFKALEKKEDRESAAADLFGQALMMAPSFDD
jgi:hypothetical protein